jgi:hypothetical protein
VRDIDAHVLVEYDGAAGGQGKLRDVNASQWYVIDN